MKQNLPVPVIPARPVPARPGRPGVVVRASQPVGRWLRSPLGTALADAAPGVLRALASATRPREERAAPGGPAPATLTGVTVTELRVTVASTELRQTVIRSTSAWWAAPVPERPRRDPRVRILAGALGLGGMLAGLAVAHRSLPRGPRQPSEQRERVQA